MNIFNEKFFVLTCFLYYANMYVMSGSMGWVTKLVAAFLMGLVMCVNVLIVDDIARDGGFLKGKIWFNLD